MDKEQVAEILAEIGTLLELKGENPFKTRAYANAARTIEGLSEPLAKIVAENRLGEIKGIGEALTKKSPNSFTTGKLKYYDWNGRSRAKRTTIAEGEPMLAGREAEGDV